MVATASPWTHGSWSPPRPRRPGSSARLARSTTPGPPTTSGRILQALEGLVSPTMAVLGLTFKADVDDLRQSPALVITEQVAAGAPHAQILVAEPRADALPPSLARWANVRLTGCRQAVERADVVWCWSATRSSPISIRSCSRGGPSLMPQGSGAAGVPGWRGRRTWAVDVSSVRLCAPCTGPDSASSSKQWGPASPGRGHPIRAQPELQGPGGRGRYRAGSRHAELW